jgi:sulfur transfer protein SufE
MERTRTGCRNRVWFKEQQSDATIHPVNPEATLQGCHEAA